MKLKPRDSYKLFYEVAHRMILLKKKPFSMKEIFDDYSKVCSSNINLDWTKKLLLQVLDDLLNEGMVKMIRDGTQSYYTIFIENENQTRKKPKHETSIEEEIAGLYLQ